jgi:hypothetical protein
VKAGLANIECAMPAIPAAQKKNLKTSEAYSIYYTNSGQKKE